MVRFLLIYLILISFIFAIAPPSISAQDYGDSGYGDPGYGDGGNYGDSNAGYGDGYGDGGQYGDDRNGDYSDSTPSYGDSGPGYADTPYSDTPAYGDSPGYGDTSPGYGDNPGYGDTPGYGDSPPPVNNFSQLLPQGDCIGINPNMHISWDPYTDTAPSSYRIIYITDEVGAQQQSTGPLASTVRSYDFNPSTIALTPGKQYSFIIGAFDASGTLLAWSDYLLSSQKFGTYTTYPDNCSPTPPPKPVISLWFNNDLPQWQVRQKAAAVTLNWQVVNATSCTASSDPVKSYWTGGPNSVVNPVTSPTGSYQPLDTQSIGYFKYILTCTNTNSSGLSSTDQGVATLTVTQLQKPYIETTGGDVHTNEFINIPE